MAKFTFKQAVGLRTRTVAFAITSLFTSCMPLREEAQPVEAPETFPLQLTGDGKRDGILKRLNEMEGVQSAYRKGWLGGIIVPHDAKEIKGILGKSIENVVMDRNIANRWESFMKAEQMFNALDSEGYAVLSYPSHTTALGKAKVAWILLGKRFFDLNPNVQKEIIEGELTHLRSSVEGIRPTDGPQFTNEDYASMRYVNIDGIYKFHGFCGTFLRVKQGREQYGEDFAKAIEARVAFELEKYAEIK